MKTAIWSISSVAAIAILAWLGRSVVEGLDSGKANQKRKPSQGFSEYGNEASSRHSKRSDADENVTEKGNSPTRGTGSAPALLMPGMFRLSPDVVEIVLKEKDNLPLSAAALLWTRDESLWEKAREQMSSQPIVAATIAFSGRNDQERLDAAKSLMALEPDNPLGYVAALDVSSRSGNVSQIDALLASMPAGEHMNPYAAEMRSGSRELFEFSGLDPVQKGLLLTQDNWQLKIVQSISGLSRLCSADIPPEDKAGRASLILNLIDGCRSSGGETLPGEALMHLSRVEELALRRLPADYQLVNGRTVSQEASRISTERIEDIEKQRSISNALKTLDYEAVGDYYRILDTQGDAAASKWLIGE